MDGKSRTVLVIEDNEINREILSDILSDDYNVLSAENGRIGLDILSGRKAEIDLVLLDIRMPVLDGYGVLRAMKDDPDMSEIPVIVTTGDESGSDEQVCLQLGASDFVRKPYSPIIVKLRIESLLRLVETTRSIHQKTSFLQNFNHEIRTPLNAIYGFAQLLCTPGMEISEEEKQQYSTYISDSYSLIDMMLNDIHDITDSENGTYSIVRQDFRINEVCRSAISSTRHCAQEGVRMDFTTELSDDAIINSDERRIHQVLVNYLTNACKHTSEGEIILHCSDTERPGRIVLSVTDTGPGIPADKAEIIFKRFVKLDEYKQGAGLGLSICRLIAENLGAEACLDTTYTGRGARFILVL